MSAYEEKPKGRGHQNRHFKWSPNKMAHSKKTKKTQTGGNYDDILTKIKQINKEEMAQLFKEKEALKRRQIFRRILQRTMELVTLATHS